MVKVFLLFISLSTAAHAAELKLAVGEQQVLKFSTIEQVQVGNPKVLKVSHLTDQTQLLVQGLARGSTSLLVWTTTGTENFAVQVYSKLTLHLEKEIQEALKDIEGIGIHSIGNRVLIRGAVYRESDWITIQKISESYKEILNLAKLHPMARQMAAQKINEMLQGSRLGTISATVNGSELLLEGYTTSENNKKKILEIAKGYSPSVKDLIEVTPDNPLVAINVKMVEIKRSSMQGFGVQYPAALPITIQSQGSLQNGNFGAFSTLLSQAELLLKFLEEKGAARILANPILSCQSGGEANFLAGGEIPIKSFTRWASRIHWKSYGIILRIKPQILPSQKIFTEVEAEVSTLDGSTAIEGVPGLLTRKIKTSFATLPDQTIAISGLVSQEASHDVSKIPIIGDLPIVGPLFRSENFRKRNSELLVFIMTSHIPIPPQKIQKFERGFQKIQKELTP